METFESVLGKVELTSERKSHVLKFHPEVKKFLKSFAETLAKPHALRISKFDGTVYLFYRQYKHKFLAIVVKTNHRKFVLTAYITNKLQHLPL